MVDVHTKKQRSYNMSRIRSKDTKPEMLVRSMVHKMGYRYSLHRKDLPGKPDLALVKHHKVIFVHGCFWHMHNCRYGRVKPKTNAKFWQEKRAATVARDKRNLRQLKKDGWKVLVIWECWTKTPERLLTQLNKFLLSFK